VTRSRAALLILFVLLGLAAAGCGGDDNEATATTEATTETTESSGSGGGTTLNGSVGPGFDISLEGTDGLTAGSYTLVVNDQSADHNFHLTGPGGVDVSTEVDETGQKSFDVELEAGEYTFVCDPHASQMKGTFTVG
jgi:plastocyanin